ncbi:acyl carrier protein [Wukongibacter sp. M2B1]|uniref:acyl carrier protein n=1 Tax=Wukongibacter sp. M2B1 TaxID=3088895 RepID=UPI003D78D901
MNIKNEVTEIVCEIIGMEPSEINPDASFSDDMGIDSLRALEILAAIENKYGITIDPERLKDMGSLNKVIKVTEEHIGDCDK